MMQSCNSHCSQHEEYRLEVGRSSFFQLSKKSGQDVLSDASSLNRVPTVGEWGVAG
ncbi:hypothetical protein OESDEN_01131 [Oesophagostomum dentatum]|uniref:Uncharacterized protein n=1 Tax=Oesophagostomum dentatum TaxID=61180 RepID=A0A0B1TSR9_OESDE|nr:hypothetical protein OESDEN_01131 [Oesophagostomum dentatum]